MIKISYSNVVKKVTLNAQTLSDLKAKVVVVFPELKGAELNMFYIDDGDKIDVSNDADVENMLADNLPVYKLFVEATKLLDNPTIAPVPIVEPQLLTIQVTTTHEKPDTQEVHPPRTMYPQMEADLNSSPKICKQKKAQLTEDEKRICGMANKLVKGKTLTSVEMNEFANFLLENPDALKDRKLKYLEVLKAKELILGLTSAEQEAFNELTIIFTNKQNKKECHKKSPKCVAPTKPVEAPKSTPADPTESPTITPAPLTEGPQKKKSPKDKKVSFKNAPDHSKLRGPLIKWFHTRSEMPIDAAGELEDLMITHPKLFESKPHLRVIFLTYKQSIYGLSEEEEKELEHVKQPCNRKREMKCPKFPYYICDGCDAEPIVGFRYNSKIIPNYDLCDKCFTSIVNKEDFMCLPIPKSTENRPPKAKRCPKRLPNSHPRFSCDGCNATPIVGNRYHSKVVENFDYCEKCYTNAVNKEDFTCIQPPCTNKVDLNDPNTILIDIDPNQVEAGLKFVEELLGGCKQNTKEMPPLKDMFKNCGFAKDLFKNGDFAKNIQTFLDPLIDSFMGGAKATPANPPTPTSTPLETPAQKPKKCEPKVDASLLNGEFAAEVSSFPANPTPNDKIIYKTFIVKNTGKVEWNSECCLVAADSWLKLQKVKLPSLKVGEQGVVTVSIPNLGFPVFEINLGFKYSGTLYGSTYKVKIAQQSVMNKDTPQK